MSRTDPGANAPQATKTGRCPQQKWQGFERTLGACLEVSGDATFRNRAGRTLRLATGVELAGAPLYLELLAPPDYVRSLMNEGWFRAGSGQGPVSKQGRDTGNVAGPMLGKQVFGAPEAEVDSIIEILRTLMKVKDPHDLLYTTSSVVWADHLSKTAPGFGLVWHHDIVGGSARGAGGGSRDSDRHCLKCGQPLTSAESRALGYGPECWRQMQGGGVNQRRR